MRLVRIHIARERDQVAIVFGGRTIAGCHHCLAHEHARIKLDQRLGARIDIAFDESVECKQPVRASSFVDVAVVASGMTPIHHRELGTTVGQRFFGRSSSDQIEPPPMSARFEHVHIERLETLMHTSGPVDATGSRVVLEVAIEHDFVAVFVRVGPMQDEGRVGLEPLDVGSGAVPRNDGETTRKVTPELV